MNQAIVVTDGKRAISHPHGQSFPILAAVATWLEGKKPATRRAYQRAIDDFTAFLDIGPDELADVTPLDVARWKESMKVGGKADSTVHQRLSAISSMYRQLARPQMDGKPLVAFNPVDGVGRNDLDISPYANAKKMTAAQFNAIMAEIDAATENGARDAAMFMFYAICGRRAAEVANLRRRDIRQDGDAVLYRVRLKGGKVEWKQLPPPVWKAIQRYWDVAERRPAADEPLFTATVDNARYLHGDDVVAENRPISTDAVAQALNRYAKRAGINPEDVTIHSLRHLGAEQYYLASGKDVVATQRFLNHSHLNTTQVYLEQLEGQEHKHWKQMMAALGMAG